MGNLQIHSKYGGYLFQEGNLANKTAPTRKTERILGY